MPIRLLRSHLLMGTACHALLTWAKAQSQRTWPTRPVRIVSINNTSTGMDELGRPLTQFLATQLKQNFFIEPKLGAGSILAFEAVPCAPSDGYTPPLTVESSMPTAPAFFKKLLYVQNRNLTPMARVSALPDTKVALATSPIARSKKLLRTALRHPDRLNYGTSSAELSLHHALTQYRGQGFKSGHSVQGYD